LVKEDSIHVKVKVDLDQEDREFADSLSANMERTDQQRITSPGGDDFTEKVKQALIDIKEDEKESDQFSKVLQETSDESIQDTVGDIGEQIRSSPKFRKQVLDALGLDPKQLAQFARNPSAMGAMRIGAGAAGGAVTGPLAIALLVKPVTEAIIAELQRPGGLLDKRVKIDSTKEFFALLSRQTRQNTRIGDRHIVISQLKGWRANEGYTSTNTSQLIRTNADRVLDIGLFERAEGLR